MFLFLTIEIRGNVFLKTNLFYSRGDFESFCEL